MSEAAARTVTPDSVPAPEERHSVGALIMAKNCPALLDDCLSNLGWVDEVLVADASDDDRIGQLVQAKYPNVQHIRDATDDWRARAANVLPKMTSEYILGVDTDEVYPPATARAILNALRRPCPYDGFRIPSVNAFYGVEVGPSGDLFMRLQRKESIRFPTGTVHNPVETEGAVGDIGEPYYHYKEGIMVASAAKHFRYEAIDARKLTDDELERLRIDKPGALRMLRNAAKAWLRLNWQYLKWLWIFRRCGWVAIFMALNQTLWGIARSTTPTEESRFRRGLQKKDGRGYIDL
jgi:hypothetical protein